jgi:hypothetical protein
VWVVDSTPVGMRPLPGNSQALGPGRMGAVRVLRLPFPLLLGLRLHLVATPGGLPVAFALTGAKADERQVLLAILDADPALTVTRPCQILITPLRQVIESVNETFNASITHCAFFSSGVLERSSLGGFYLDTQAAAASAADVHGGEFAALDLVQNGLPGDAEGGGGLPQW